MLDIIIILLLTLLAIWAWRFFNWVWVEPRKMEKFLRSQGLKGNPYKFLHGDAKENEEMYKEAHSKPIDPRDDVVPRIMPFIEKTVKTYGKNAFAWIGPRPRLIISEGELMRTALIKHRIFQKSFRAVNQLIRLAVGGLVYYEGDEWSKSRMKLNPAFHLDKLKDMVPAMETNTMKILNQWMDKISKDGEGVIDVLPDIEDYSGSVVTQSLFHTTYDDDKRKSFHYLRAITVLTDNAPKPFNFPGSQYWPTQSKKRAKEMEKHIRQSFTNMINERLKKRLAGDRNSNSDLFDLFLDELYDTEKKISPRERDSIIEEAIAQSKLFYLTGYDTTSNLLVWTMVSLAFHQDWQARAREEAFEVLGHNKTLTHDGLSQLKIINMIMNEVLRLYPPVMELSRVVEEDTQLGNLRIPKGVLIQLPIALLHRDPEIWGKDVHEFRPDRFAEGVLKAANGQAAYLPFSWGPRICIGQNFALNEGRAFLAQLLRLFSFELAPNYKHAPYAAFTIQAQFGAPILLRKL